MADRMTFEQLYNHMEQYIELPEERWKLVTRVKRGISDPFQVGGYSRDQSYLEGAIDVLENLEKIDFVLLMSGKLCLDELDRVKRISRVDSIKLPSFMKNLQSYKDKLRLIGIVNGIIEPKGTQVIINDILVFDHRIKEEMDQTNGDQNSVKKSINDHAELFNLNGKNRNLTSIEIKRYINKKIVLNTKNTLDIGTKPKIANDESSLCILL